jgi:hypothetical protein
MSFRILMVLLAPLTFAAGQQAASKPEDSSTPAKDSQSSRPHVRFGGLFVGAGYSHFSGYPGFGYYPGYWGYGFDPFLFSGFAPGYATGFAYQPNMGEVKIQTSQKSASVYLNGAFAGQADHLKSMWLDPGVYDLEMRDGARKYARRIYVLSGKTLRMKPELMEQGAQP